MSEARNLELIHLDEPSEFTYWPDVPGCSEDELQRIGVRRHLALVRDLSRTDRLTVDRTKLADVADGRARWRHA